MMLSIASEALAVAASTILESLSYSAMIQSTPIWVANLIFSAACWSDGSAVATIRRLLRLLSTTTRKAWQILASSRFLGSRCRSMASRSSSGRAEGGRHGVRQIGSRHRAGAGQFGDEAVAVGLGLAGDVFGRLLSELAGRNQRARQARKGHGGASMTAGSTAAMGEFVLDGNEPLPFVRGATDHRSLPSWCKSFARQQPRRQLVRSHAGKGLVGVRGFEPPASTSRT